MKNTAFDIFLIDGKGIEIHVSVISAGSVKKLELKTAPEKENPFTGRRYSKRPDGLAVKEVRVDMGEPVLEPEKIPVKLNITGDIITDEINMETQKICIMQPIVTDVREYKMTCVSMGNPHCVIYVEDVDGFDVSGEGRKLEVSEHFPKRVNVEFVQVTGRDSIKMRVWERGAGETYACGTGACGAVVSSILNGFTENTVIVSLKGGKLSITWDREANRVFMTGTAVTVYTGEI